MRNRLIVILASLVLTTGLYSDGLAQLPEDSDIYDEYLRLTNDGRADEALAELDRIIGENPGTRIEQSARLYRATENVSPENAEYVLGQLQGLINDYPRSPYSAMARMLLLDYQYSAESQVLERQAAADELFVDFGLPSLSSLASGEAVKGEKPQDLTDEEYLYLVETLLPMGVSGLDGEQRMNAVTFLCLNYPEIFSPTYASRATTDEVLGVISGPTDFIVPKASSDNAPPNLSLEVPSDSQVLSPTVVSVRCDDGPVGTKGIDLSSAEFYVDGSKRELIKGVAEIRNDRWEAILSITVELAPGPHSGVFRLADLAGNQAELPFSFVVIEPDTGSDLTLPTTKDSTIRAQKPHRNEGANPRLFLSHRLEARNKSLNPLVAFDLANTDLNGLTKATLVMNIQDCDLPRRWGNQGRFIEAHPMTQPWTEGNGNKYRQKGQEGRTKGEGTGVTWFSPADTQIRNNRPNGSSQWSGARMSLGPKTAPPVVVTNGQTGPIEFDVTQDVLNGYYEGWLLKKQDEAKFGNIRFFSKEAGDPEIAPKLLLEFSGPVAKASSTESLIASFASAPRLLRAKVSNSERKALRELLIESPTASEMGEKLIQATALINPTVGHASVAAYRVWLS